MKHRVVAVYDRDRGKGGIQGRWRRGGGEGRKGGDEEGWEGKLRRYHCSETHSAPVPIQ